MERIVIGPCKCGGYGQVLNEAAEKEAGTCHLGICGDHFGHFVTAKLKDKDDCRQGIVISNDPLIIRGVLGVYECEGVPTVVDA